MSSSTPKPPYSTGGPGPGPNRRDPPTPVWPYPSKSRGGGGGGSGGSGHPAPGAIPLPDGSVIPGGGGRGGVERLADDPEFLIVTPSEAAALAEAEGLAIFPLVPGEKRPAPGMRWSKVSTSNPKEVERLFERHGVGEARLSGVGIDCGKSWLVVIDVDGPISEELQRMLDANPTLTWASATKGKPHHVYKARVGGLDDQVGCPRLGGADVKGVGGLVARSRKPSLSGPGVTPVELPRSLLALIKREMRSGAFTAADGERGPLVTAHDLEGWLDGVAVARVPDVAAVAALDEKLGEFARKVDEGMPRREAAREVSLGMAIEARTGLYGGREAFEKLGEEYRSARVGDVYGRNGGDPEKGWTEGRQRDYVGLWRGAVSRILAGWFDGDIAERAERFGIWDESEFSELEGVLEAAVPVEEAEAEPESEPEPAPGGFEVSRESSREAISAREAALVEAAAAVESRRAGGVGGEEPAWPDPEPLSGVAVAVPLVVPSAVGVVVAGLSGMVGVDVRMVCGPVMSSVSAVLGGGVVVWVRGGWRETTALWSLVFAASGERKTAVAEWLFRAVDGVAQAESERRGRSVGAVGPRLVLAAALEDLAKARTAVARVDAAAAVAEARKRVPALPGGFVVSDPTPEAAEVVMAAHGECCFLITDEAAKLLRRLTGGRSGQGEPDFTTFVKGFSGSFIATPRISREMVRLENPYLVMCLFTQPDVGRTVLGRCEEAVTEGFVPRLMISFPPPASAESRMGVRRV